MACLHIGFLPHVSDEDKRKLEAFGLMHSHYRYHPGWTDHFFLLFVVKTRLSDVAQEEEIKGCEPWTNHLAWILVRRAQESPRNVWPGQSSRWIKNRCAGI